MFDAEHKVKDAIGDINSLNLFTSPFHIATGIAAQLTKSFDTKWPACGV